MSAFNVNTCNVWVLSAPPRKNCPPLRRRLVQYLSKMSKRFEIGHVLQGICKGFFFLEFVLIYRAHVKISTRLGPFNDNTRVWLCYNFESPSTYTRRSGKFHLFTTSRLHNYSLNKYYVVIFVFSQWVISFPWHSLAEILLKGKVGGWRFSFLNTYNYSFLCYRNDYALWNCNWIVESNLLYMPRQWYHNLRCLCTFEAELLKKKINFRWHFITIVIFKYISHRKTLKNLKIICVFIQRLDICLGDLWRNIYNMRMKATLIKITSGFMI